ncbi:MAG: hypothetical protein WC787_02230 [Patescibacteria group bacterium]|jgi:hypothetical protein
MPETSSDLPIRLGDSTLIAFPRDAHSLRGIYPPICRLADFVVRTGIGDDGHLFELGRHNKTWLAEEARNGHVVLLDHPVVCPRTTVIVCVPEHDAEFLKGIVELQHVRKLDAYAGSIDLYQSHDIFWRIIRERVPPHDLKHRKEIFAMMIACRYLFDQKGYLALARTVQSILLRGERKAVQEMTALTKLYLLRFGRKAPSEI